MQPSEPSSDYKTLLRLTLETSKEHAGASSQIASEMNSLRDDILGFRGEFLSYTLKEAERDVVISRLDAWLSAQVKATLDANEQHVLDTKKPGVIERGWGAFAKAMESSGVRTAFIAIAVPVLTTIGLGIASALTGAKVEIPVTLPAVHTSPEVGHELPP